MDRIVQIEQLEHHIGLLSFEVKINKNSTYVKGYINYYICIKFKSSSIQNGIRNVKKVQILRGVGGAVMFLVVGTIGQEERPPRDQLWMEQCLTLLKYWTI